VRTVCGDWKRVTSYSVMGFHGITAVFLDPPYSSDAGRDPNIYSVDDLDVARDVRDWAVENGDDPLLRIALCGYESEHDMPDSWSVFKWVAQGGFGNKSNKTGKKNKDRERIWFSPHCLDPQPEPSGPPTLFDENEEQ